MENVGFQPSGEEIERALMDLGPLLGVTIKEEVPEELPDAASGSAPAPRLNVSGNIAESGGGDGGEGGDGGGGGAPSAGVAPPEGADSLASPEERSPAAARCVLCRAALAHQDGTPKLMECLHSACEPCINAKLEERQAASRDFLGAERVTVACPACRLQCQVANMIDQRFVLEKMASEQAGSTGTSASQQCSSCEDTEPATSYCVDCAEFICDNCVNAHQRLKITKDHTIKSKQEAVAELQAAQASQDMFCRYHPQERLTLFCETCDRLTCRDCQLQQHRDHKYQFSSEMAAQARSGIAALLSEVSYKRVLLGSAMKVIRDRQALIADKKKALVHEITQTVVKLTNAINTRGKQLVLRLNEVCDAKQRTLSEKKEALEQLAAITDHCVSFVNGALHQGSDTAVLYSKRAVCAHLQRIKSRRADIPNPEIPVRISLALDKLPDLVRVLSSIGAIVVDGKVDGAGGAAGAGGGGAQGPYHPPPAPAPAPAPAAAPASAIMALQHVAMHQPFVQGGYMALGARHARAPPPHVTSTTHPHQLHGMNELNLRGLLNAQAARGRPPHVAAAHHAHAHAMHAYQQMMGYASNAFNVSNSGAGAGGSGRRSGGPRTPSPAPQPSFYAPQPQPQPAPQPAPQPQPAKWHIPQQARANGAAEAGGAACGGAGGGAGAEYKITLGRARAPPAAVTSTNPKTPSPSLNGTSLGGSALELDAVCAESVQDLMATIAKLDSNGVQVVPEQGPAPRAPPAPSPAPHVHSSTDDPRPGRAVAGAGAEAGAGAGDPNEDWCAVCMDGGELMCCDKCPKVFHQYCHIPTIEKLPDETETWQCLLCVNLSEIEEDPAEAAAAAAVGALSPRLQRVVERLTLELYCQYEPSLPFREPVPPDNAHYHAKISRPMCLDMIRMKLQPRSPQRYAHVAQFIADCRLLFRNAYTYNPPDSSIYKDAKRLEEFFDAQLLKWLPEYADIAPGAAPPPALVAAPPAGAPPLAGAPPPAGAPPLPAWPDAPPPKRPRPDANC